jgi:AcrR family transcriptional regulator
VASDKVDGGSFGGQARSVELLWGAQGRRTRGPKPGLSRERIVQAAIDIADGEGLAAVSMQRVASEFGFTTMSLYRYVPGKNELVALMVDTAVGQPPDLASIRGGWRPKLAEWARLTWQGFRRHPWFLEAALQTVMGPNQLGWLEAATAAMAGTGLVGDELVQSILVVNGHVRSMAPFTIARVVDGAELTNEEWAGAMVTLLDEHRDRFPALTAAIAAGAFGPSGEDPIEFGLQRILDGIEVLIAERSAKG